MKNLKSKAFHYILFVCVMAMVIIVYAFAVKYRAEGKVTTLKSDYTITYNNSETFEYVELDSFRLPVTNKGDVVILKRTLPEGLPNNTTMRMHMVFSVTQVIVDGKLIFEYGLDDYKEGKMLGYGTKFVPLPDGSAGKPLEIRMYVTEDNAFSTIAPPEIYMESSVVESFYGGLAIPLVVSTALIVVGICISIVTFCLYFKSYSMEKLFCVGVLAVCIGCWSLCSYNLDSIFTQSLRVKTYLEYLSFYLLMFPLLLYFRVDVENRGKKAETIVYYFLLFTELSLFVVACVCQAMGTVHFPDFVKPAQAIMAFGGLFILYLLIQDMRNEKSHKILVLGFVIMLFLAGRDLIMFNVYKYFAKEGTESDYNSYVAIGALALVVAMLVDFILEMKKQMYRNAEHEFLEKIAYEDVLTNLYTRRKCEEVFSEIDNRNYEFGIIQFDLNALKYTNDTYGHEAGDELIVSFANVLRNTFNEGEILGRMGGDEFIVIITDSYEYDFKRMLSKFEDELIVENSTNRLDKEPVSASYGYCTSKELKNNPKANEVYLEADKRMYASKEKYYKKNGGRRRYDHA